MREFVIPSLSAGGVNAANGADIPVIRPKLGVWY